MKCIIAWLQVISGWITINYDYKINAWIAGVRRRLARQYVAIDLMPQPHYSQLKEHNKRPGRGTYRVYMHREITILRAYLATLTEKEEQTLVRVELMFLEKCYNKNEERIKKKIYLLSKKIVH